jgi:hypothetical protein
MYTLLFAVGAVFIHRNDFQRQWLAWTVLGAMVLWTLATRLCYTRVSRRWAGSWSSTCC